MAKGEFGGIKRSKPAASLDEFVETAKVDGSRKYHTPENGRRGRSMTDPETGKKISLGGKTLQIPLNAYEVDLLNRAAAIAGISVAAYVRSTMIRLAKEKLGLTEKTF
ncbi:TPA: hypothetical protein QCI16_004483 [Enterobacter ludwigii]|nr:hypothetical protein [Enterobacter ludwigii]HDR2600261.1 hypothetical protein [Enterobacter ludwigii]